MSVSGQFLLVYSTHDRETYHETHDLIENIRRSHGSMLSISVICGSYLDNITGNEVDTLKSSNDRAEFSG